MQQARISSPFRTAGVMSVLAMALALVACDKADDKTAGQRLDSAVAQTQSAAADVQHKMESAAQQAGEVTRDAASHAVAVMDDVGITAKVSGGLAKDSELSVLKIDVDTRNGIVTLNGSVKTEEARLRAAQIALAVQGVQSVVNRLTVAAG